MDNCQCATRVADISEYRRVREYRNSGTDRLNEMIGDRQSPSFDTRAAALRRIIAVAMAPSDPDRARATAYLFEREGISVGVA